MSNGSTLIENIEFRTAAPKRPMPGLDETLLKLERMSSALKTLQAQMAGISTRSVFKLDARQFEASLRNLGATKGSQSVSKMAKLLGFPDKNDILRVAQETERVLQDNIARIQRRMEKTGMGKRALENAKREIRELQAASFFTDASAMKFKNPRKAGEFFERYSKPALSNIQATEKWIAAALGGATPLTVDPATLQAALANVATKGGGAAGSGSRKTSGPGVPVSLPKASGNLVEERVDLRGGHQSVRRRYLETVGKTIDEFWKDTEKLGTVTTTNAMRKAKESFNRAIASIQNDIAQQRGAWTKPVQLPDSAVKFNGQKYFIRGRENLGQWKDENDALAALRKSNQSSFPTRANIGKLREQAAAQALALVSGKQGDELEKLGLGGLVDRAKKFAAAQQVAAQKDYEAHNSLLASEAQKVFRLRKQLDAARLKGEKEEQRRLEAEIRQIEQRSKSLGKFNQAQTKSAAQAAGMAQKVSNFNLQQSQKQQYRQATTAAAQMALNDFLAGGGNVIRTKSAYKGQPGTVVAEKVDNGMLQTLTVTYGKMGATANMTTKAVKELRQETGLLTGDFIKNTLKVTAWTASVAALYGTLGLVKSGFTSTIEIGAQMARLDQVFTKIGGSTQDLSRDVLGLAAVYGRSSKEAMDAAIQWSRMGLTRIQVQEAVRVSLMAANVAELSAADATDHLQAIMRNFNLQVGELRSKLGELNQISNTYNVTNRDMLEGISRSAAVAKQAGLPLEELMGIIGATVGATKQSGGQVGNALKSTMLSLSNPDLQKKLRQNFGFEMTTGGEDIKDMSRALGDLYVAYSRMNEMERQSLLFNVAGKFQANRLAAMLDNYVRAQLLAIDAQMNLNSAEKENEKIVGTLKAQLAGLVTEWEKFALIQADGPVKALTEVTKALRGVFALMNTPVGATATTGIMALLTAASAKTLLTGLSVKNNGFLGRSGAAVMGAANTVNSLINTSVARFVTTSAAGRAGMGLPGAGVHRSPGGALMPGMIGPMPFNAAQLPLLERFIHRTNVLGEAALRTGARMRTAGAAGSSFFTAFGVGAKAVAAATMAVSEFLVPLALVYVGIKAFNLAMEGLGVTSDKANSKLEKLTAEAERARAAASALGQAVRLLNTAQEAFSPGKISAFPTDQAQQMLNAVATVSFLDEKDTAKKKQQTAELEKQLRLLYEQKDAQGIQKILSEQVARAQKARHEEMLAELDATSRAIAAQEAELARLKGKRGGFFGMFASETREKNIAETEGRIAELRGKSISMQLDEEEQITGEMEKQLAYNTRHLAALEREKVALDAIAGVYEQIRTNTPLDKAVVQSAKLTAQMMAETANIQRLQQRLEVDKPGQAERDAKVSELREQLKLVEEGRARTQSQFDASRRQSDAAAAAGNESLGGALLSGSAMSEAQRQIEEYQRLIEQLKADIEKASLGTLPGMKGQADAVSIGTQIRTSQDKRKQLESERAGVDAGMSLFQRQTVFGFGRDEIGRGATAVSYGANETEKLMREQAYLQQRINELNNKRNKTEFDYGQLIEATTRKSQVMLSLLDRQANVQREINQLIVDGGREFMKSFFTAGPAEMLRKLSAFRMAFGKDGKKRDLSSGEFFGMGVGMRQEFGMLNPQFNPEMIALKQERARLEKELKALKSKGDLNPDGSMTDKGANGFATQMAEALKSALAGLDSKLLGALPTAALESASQTMDRAASKFERAVDRLLVGDIPSVSSGPIRAPSLSVAPAPANSGGRLGGTR